MTGVQSLLDVAKSYTNVDKANISKSENMQSEMNAFSNVFEKAKNSYDYTRETKFESFSEKDLLNQNNNQIRDDYKSRYNENNQVHNKQSEVADKRNEDYNQNANQLAYIDNNSLQTKKETDTASSKNKSQNTEKAATKEKKSEIIKDKEKVQENPNKDTKQTNVDAENQLLNSRIQLASSIEIKVPDNKNNLHAKKPTTEASGKKNEIKLNDNQNVAVLSGKTQAQKVQASQNLLELNESKAVNKIDKKTDQQEKVTSKQSEHINKLQLKETEQIQQEKLSKPQSVEGNQAAQKVKEKQLEGQEVKQTNAGEVQKQNNAENNPTKTAKDSENKIEVKIEPKANEHAKAPVQETVKQAQTEPQENKQTEVAVTEGKKEVKSQHTLEKSKSNADKIDYNQAQPEVVKQNNQSSSKESDLNHKNNQQHNEAELSKINTQAMQHSNENSAVKANFDKSVQFERIFDAKHPKPLADSVMNQVVKNISNDLSANKSQVTIALRPDNLGKVEINLVTTNGALTAQITAENSQVKDVLTKGLETLKQSLQDQGINVNKLVVQVQESSTSNNNNFQSEQGSQRFEQANYNSGSHNSNSSNHASGNGKFSGYSEFDEAENADMNGESDQTQVSKGNSALYNGKVDYRV